MLAVKKPSPLIVGIPEGELSEEIKNVLLHLAPVGFILFKRNCENKQQLKKLCTELKQFSPMAEPLIFIDQEGGRVNRIDWEEYMAPAGRLIGDLFLEDKVKGLRAATLNGYLIASQLVNYGINVNCLPLADVAFKNMHDVIGDRAFSDNPKNVAVLCAATISGLMAGGVWPVIKHAPGHGRAIADSHKELPTVDIELEELKQTDFYPFMVNKECPFVMTAHILYSKLDSKVATQSNIIINNILKGEIGLKGLIVSDDLNMQALSGSIKQRAELSLKAGCDILLHCSGKMEELKELVGIKDISSSALNYLENLPSLGKANNDDIAKAKLEIKGLLS